MRVGMASCLRKVNEAELTLGLAIERREERAGWTVECLSETKARKTEMKAELKKKWGRSSATRHQKVSKIQCGG
jgi:hypothetical protein